MACIGDKLFLPTGVFDFRTDDTGRKNDDKCQGDRKAYEADETGNHQDSPVGADLRGAVQHDDHRLPAVDDAAPEVVIAKPAITGFHEISSFGGERGLFVREPAHMRGLHIRHRTVLVKSGGKISRGIMELRRKIIKCGIIRPAGNRFHLFPVNGIRLCPGSFALSPGMSAACPERLPGTRKVAVQGQHVIQDFVDLPLSDEIIGDIDTGSQEKHNKKISDRGNLYEFEPQFLDRSCVHVYSCFEDWDVYGTVNK